MPKQKIATLLLILSPLVIYLEWGDKNTFLAEAAVEVLRGLASHPEGLLHPLILLPLAGQVMLLISLFLPKPHRWLLYTALIASSVFPMIVLTIGLLLLHPWITLSTLPFMASAVFSLKIYHRPK